MKQIRWIVLFSAWLCAGVVAAQTDAPQGGTPKDGTPKGGMPRVDPMIVSDVAPPRPGTPLSQRALLTTPAPIKGVLSWTLETRRIRYRYQATALSRDGKLLATGGIDGIIRLWDVTTGKMVRALVGHDSYVYGLEFSPGGKYLASGGAFDYTARIWDVTTGQPLRILKGHPTYIVQVAWSPDSTKLIAAGGESGDISVWNVLTGLKVVKGSIGQPILSVSVDPHGERFAAVTNESPVLLVSTATGKVERSFGNADDKYVRVAWSPDGKVVAAGSSKGTFLYDPTTGKAAVKLDPTAVALDWTADSSRLATACGDATLRLWNAADGKLVHKVPGSANMLHLYDGASALIGDGAGLATFDWADANRNARYDISGIEWPIWQPGRPVVTGILTTSLSLWEPATGHRRVKLDGHTAAIPAYAWSPDGKSIVTASHDKTLRLYDSAGKLIHTLTKHTAPVLSVAWSPDGKEIASGGQDKQTIIWDAKSGNATHTITDHRAGITCLAYSPGGSTLAAGGDDGKVFLYLRPGYKAAKPLATPNQTHAFSLAWNADGKTLAVGDINGTGLLWSPAKGKLIAEIPTVGSPPHINSMVFYAKGEMLATARGNHTLVLWNTATTKAGHSLPTMAPAQHVVFAAPYLAVASQDRTCRFFEPISGKLKGLLIAEPEQIVAVTMDGHYRADGPAVDGLVYVVQTTRGQETLTPAEFTKQYRRKNDPAQVKFAGK